MKKWGFLLLLLLALGYAIVQIAPYFQEEKIEIKDIEDNRVSGETKQIEVLTEHVHKGNLLLVNQDYPVQKDSTKEDIVSLFGQEELTQGYVLLNGDIELSASIAKKFSEMVAAANKDGVNHFLISSGFRGFDQQAALFQEMGSSYALEAGHSEHHLGTALDVGSTQMQMSKAPEGRWIEDHAWKYGFILRYPADKTDVTGIEYEPWHIRYVGLPHSAIMKENNFALEEYLDYLKEEQAFSASRNGENYEIYYYPVNSDTTIEIPAGERYEISGNNMDGVIVTVFMDKNIAE
ncbi:M15 family metallopeptidase [Gracilibacillus oryzae]|uniref:M15 family metallopeptidase n=1 Tax=Gracilibacillus oryzae TaxID=1672701 RepID=A0A7C8GQL9_9BACI|nr:M15 family metallopeptidase [Gracilibacillus oryzae]KAB8126082.1 M15 family metallopeptidase [Gracilibacillus oryzae]